VIKVKTIKYKDYTVSPVKLKNFSLFEEKMTKIRNIKQIRDNIDTVFLKQSISELDYKGSKISAKKAKKIFKKALNKMIEEVKE